MSGLFVLNCYLSYVEHYDVIIVGGGLAGLTSALHLSKEGYSVLVCEKQSYPHHKVCGEYVSNEVMPYFEKLGVSLVEANAVSIDTLQLTTQKGKSITTKLPLGGMGISRFCLDNLLYKKAHASGAKFKFQNVTSIRFQKDRFKVKTAENKVFSARFVIGAYGKRSILDKQLDRDFIHRKASWLGVKAHYDYNEFPENRVALHNFKGGYAGLSKTETGVVNFCYLASYQSFQREKNIDDFNRKVVMKNPFLASFLNNAKPVFDQPLTIAQISFGPKKSIENHILMCGDTAGLIHPLCGNGMAMAVHSAKIVSELIHKFMTHKGYHRHQLELDYDKQWNKTFGRRLWWGRQLQAILLSDGLSNIAMVSAIKTPGLLKKLIQNTHGEPLIPNHL